MLNLIIYSHLPKDFTYQILSNKIKNYIDLSINVIDYHDIEHISIDKNNDKLLLYEPQNENDLYDLIKLSKQFLKENTYIYFYESVFETKAVRHKWKQNKKFLINFGTVFSSYKGDVENINNIWVPCHHDLYGFSMINIDYFLYYKKNENINNYPGVKFDIEKDDSINYDLFINNNKIKFAAVQPITGSVDNYRIKIIEDISKYIELDIYGMNNNLRNLNNYKGVININDNNNYVNNIYSNRKLRAISVINKLSNYKFNFVFENEIINGYFSERFIHSMYSNSIVIYFGCKEADKIFPDIFDNGIINGWNFKDNESLCNYLKKMDDNEIITRKNIINNLREKYTNMFCQKNILKKIFKTIYYK